MTVGAEGGCGHGAPLPVPNSTPPLGAPAAGLSLWQEPPGFPPGPLMDSPIQGVMGHITEGARWQVDHRKLLFVGVRGPQFPNSWELPGDLPREHVT